MNDNKTIKVLRIITLTLTLMLLVFALAKKVGLCASDSSGGSSLIRQLPFQVGAGYGNTFTSEELSRIIEVCETDRIESYDSGYTQIDYICLIENGSDTITVRCYQNNAGTGFSRYSGSSITFPLSGSFRFVWGSLSGYDGCRVVSIRKSTLTRINGYWNSSSSTTYLDCEDLTTLAPDGSFVQTVNSDVYGMPIFISSDLSYDGVTYFSNTPQHSQGGTLTDYSDEVQNFIDSNVNDVDVSDPSNTSNVPSWLQKILSGIGTLNNTIGGGFSLIKNGINNILGAISDFSDSVIDRFDSLIGKVDSILGSLSDNTTESDLYDAWVDAYEDSYIYAFIDEFSVVDAGLKNIANTQAASSVSFTFSLPSFNVPTVSGSGSIDALANHNSVTVGFNWYTLPRFSNGDSIRDRIWLPFSAFLVIGFCWRLFAKIPSILGGQSGLSDGVHKTIELSNIYANRVN